MAETVFLDACVLYPAIPRTLLAALGAAGVVRPRWTPRVLAEWRIAAAREGMEDEAVAAAAALRRQFPDAEVTPDPDVEASLALPDPADTHVLAGAIAAGAGTLVTFNLRDFPQRRTAAHGVAVRHPDGFLWEALGTAPEATAGAIRRIAGDRDRAETRKLLKKAGLPRLGKAWAAG